MTDTDTGPVLPGSGASDYERYLRTDELLSLQKRPEERVHRDELLFQTVHQTSELWLKFTVSEVKEATAQLAADELLEAGRLLRRATRAIEFVTDQLDMLDLLDPWDYQFVRSALGHGSGFDSPGFRELAAALQAVAPAFDATLTRAGVADVTDLYLHRAAHRPLHQLAELLTDLDERLRVWRVRHYTVVARAIGEESIGIQGTPVHVLSKLIGQRQLPRLWQARSRLVDVFDSGERATAPPGPQ